MNHSRFWNVLFAAGLLLVLSGCGGGDDGVVPVGAGGVCGAGGGSFAGFQQQPRNWTAVDGEGAEFSVLVVTVGVSPCLSYQWERSDGGAFVDIAGATSLRYEIPETVYPSDDGAQFRVAVYETNDVNNITTKRSSDTARLTVRPVAINRQPTDVAAPSGGDAMFTVSASGRNLSYQWQRSADGGATFQDLAGAVGSSHTATAVGAADHNTLYRVVVTALAGALTSRAAVLTTSTAVARFIVTPPLPPGSLGYPVGSDIGFDAMGSQAGGGRQIAFWEWDFNWSGDPLEPFEIDGTFIPFLFYVYSAPGTYTVRLRITTSAPQETAEATMTVTIQ